MTFPLLRHAELVSASIPSSREIAAAEEWTLKQVQGDGSDGSRNA